MLVASPSDARSYVFASPLLARWPGMAILLTVLSFNLVGTPCETG